MAARGHLGYLFQRQPTHIPSVKPGPATIFIERDVTTVVVSMPGR